MRAQPTEGASVQRLLAPPFHVSLRFRERRESELRIQRVSVEGSKRDAPKRLKSWVRDD